MEAQDDWRERYLRLNRDLEAEREERAEAERLLTRTIVRLCVAVRGLDAFLDPNLERLRKAAQGGYSPKLGEQLGEFTDAVVAAGDRRRSDDLIGRFLERVGLSGHAAEQARGLWLKLANAPADARDADLDRLADMLGLQAIGAAAAPQRSLFGWLRRERPEDAPPGPNGVLGDLMGRFQWPAALADEVDALRGQLAAGAAPDAWVGVIERISRLAAEAVELAETETRRTEEFLGELSERLEALDQHMQGEDQRRGEARERADQLGKTMRNEVGGLSKTLRQSSDLRQLRESLVQTLDRIQRSVHQHLEHEEELRREAEAREAGLSGMLRELEQQADDLRKQASASQQLARRDPLTGMPNRRAYDERAEQEFARWRRFGGRLSLLLWDVDNFKQVNDTYGHKAGDRALQLIAATLQRRLRETDFIARFGGEEFVVLLVGASDAEALKVAESMRTAVESAGLHSNNTPVSLTVSGGLTQFRDDDDLVSVFTRADDALYRAKRKGKNCCLIG
jgi:diguanylate cyclase